MGEIESEVQTIPSNFGLAVAPVLIANRSRTDIKIRSQNVPDRSMGNLESIPVCRETKAGSAPRFVVVENLAATDFNPLGLQQIDSPQIEFAGFKR